MIDHFSAQPEGLNTQARWLAQCITHLLELDVDKSLTPESARYEAHKLWEACGAFLPPENAAARWFGREEPCIAIDAVGATAHPVEDPLGHNLPRL